LEIGLTKKVIDAWAPIFGVSGFLLAIAALKGTYFDPNLPPWVFAGLLWAAIGGVLLVGLCWAVQGTGDWLSRDVVESFRAAKRDELQDLIPFFDRVVGTPRPSLNELKEIFNANNQVFRFLEKRTKQGRKTKSAIQGFCTLLPVTKEAAVLLARDELNGLRMSRAHIAAPGKAHKTIYIGSIGGDSPKARAAVLNYVLGHIDDCATRGVTCVYTRPVTKDGLRVAKKYGFKPVSQDVGENELGRLYVLEISDRLPKLRPQRNIHRAR
jgi:hypothetical protein